MASGVLLSESLRVGAEIDTPLRVTKIARHQAGVLEAGQPADWTFIYFEVPNSDVESLADELAGALNRDGGWFCDYQTVNDKWVVFAGKVFNYQRGDASARRKAQDYALAAGVPETQLNWPE